MDKPDYWTHYLVIHQPHEMFVSNLRFLLDRIDRVRPRGHVPATVSIGPDGLAIRYTSIHEKGIEP